MTRRLICLITAILLFVSCTRKSPTGPHWEEWIANVISVSMPDSANIGVQFLVRIETVGMCDRIQPSRDVVRRIDGGYRVVPYDLHEVGGWIDVRGYEWCEHIIPFTVTTPSVLRIDVKDRDWDGTITTISNQIIILD